MKLVMLVSFLSCFFYLALGASEPAFGAPTSVQVLQAEVADLTATARTVRKLQKQTPAARTKWAAAEIKRIQKLRNRLDRDRARLTNLHKQLARLPETDELLDQILEDYRDTANAAPEALLEVLSGMGKEPSPEAVKKVEDLVSQYMQAEISKGELLTVEMVRIDLRSQESKLERVVSTQERELGSRVFAFALMAPMLEASSKNTCERLLSAANTTSAVAQRLIPQPPRRGRAQPSPEPRFVDDRHVGGPSDPHGSGRGGGGGDKKGDANNGGNVTTIDKNTGQTKDQGEIGTEHIEPSPK